MQGTNRGATQSSGRLTSNIAATVQPRSAASAAKRLLM